MDFEEKTTNLIQLVRNEEALYRPRNGKKQSEDKKHDTQHNSWKIYCSGDQQLAWEWVGDDNR